MTFDLTYCKECNSKKIRMDPEGKPYCVICGSYNLETKRITC